MGKTVESDRSSSYILNTLLEVGARSSPPPVRGTISDAPG